MAAFAAASILSAPLTASAQEGFQREGEQLGLRRGSFLFLPSIVLRGGYTDNIGRTAANRRAGSLVVIEPELSVRSDWTRHALTFDLRGRHTAYDGNFDQLEGYIDADASARLDIHARTSLTLRAGYGLKEDNGSTDHTVSGSAELTHRINRLAVTVRGGAKRFNYDENRAGVTSTVDTNVSDHIEYRGALRASYDLSSLTSLFAEADINRRDHRQPIDANGFRRGSNGYAGSLGLRMSNGSKLSGELRAGYGVQDPDDPTLARIEGVTVDGRLDWQASALTKLSLVAETELGETTLAGSAGYVGRSASFELEHLLGRKLVLNGRLTYSRDDFVGVGLVEQTYEAAIGVDYLLSRHIFLTADAAHLRFDSTNAGQDYTANTITVGVKLRR